MLLYKKLLLMTFGTTLVLHLTASFYLWLFDPFPGHNILFQLGFQNNGVLWSKVYNPRPNPQTGGPRLCTGVYSPVTCFVWLLHWGLFGFGNPVSSYIIISIAPHFLVAWDPTQLYMSLHKGGIACAGCLTAISTLLQQYCKI
jgi:hypothetical protein